MRCSIVYSKFIQQGKLEESHVEFSHVVEYIHRDQKIMLDIYKQTK